MRDVQKTLDGDALCALLQHTDALPLQITGSSMTPFLVHGRDSVLLTPIRGDTPRRGDIVLYRRDNGAYVLHRVHRCARDGTFSMLGDAQQTVEHGIRREQLVAVAHSAVRKGKRQEKGTFWWDFFAHVWPRLIPLRRTLLRLYQITLGRKS